ncbi:MAG: hypothetical protein JNK85_17005 [Verrucomicrobiales bacterium]|nr:hypothetical protein [Verrucomicrobiales bacterium]
MYSKQATARVVPSGQSHVSKVSGCASAPCAAGISMSLSIRKLILLTNG